jgi:predicted Zn-dependent protease
MHTDLSALWTQAIADFEAGRFAESEALCVQLIQQAPDKPLAYALLARICHAMGLVREATFNAFQASQR